MKKLFSVLLAVGALAQPIVSEAAREQPPTWWVNLGMGAGTNFNSSWGRTSATASELSFNGTLTEHGLLTIYSAGADARHDGGIMYGYVSRKPSSYWSASAGICYYKIAMNYRNYYDHRYLYEEIKHEGAGIPLEAQAFWTPFNHFGVGLVGHAVASKHPSTVGMVAIQVF